MLEVESDGAASFNMHGSTAYSYAYASSIETFTIDEDTLSRTGGTPGTVVGTWTFSYDTGETDEDGNPVMGTGTVTFNSDNTFSMENSEGAAYSGTYDATNITIIEQLFTATIDTASTPNTITVNFSGIKIVLTKFEK